MSFDEFAKRTAGTPEAVAGAAARAAELARKPFAEAFVNDVYPHWQGPLKSISGKQGVELVTHGHVPGFLPMPRRPADRRPGALRGPDGHDPRRRSRRCGLRLRR